MCVIVRATSEADPEAPRYDRSDVALIVSDRLTRIQMRDQVRLLLTFLGTREHCHTTATCWCGDAVELPAVPVQTISPLVSSCRG